MIVQAAAGNLKKVSLELGGKSPAIILPDADLDLAIAGAANAIFFNHGQCCCAGSRLFVHKTVYDRVVAGVSDIAGKIKVGPGLDPATEMGPLVSNEQFARVTGYIRDGREAGAKITVGGDRVGNLGYFVAPTVFENTKPDMKIMPRRSSARWCARNPSTTTISIGSQTGQRHDLWPRRQRVDAQRRHRSQARQPHPLGHGVDQLPQRLRRVTAVRRLQTVRLGVRWAKRCSTTTPRSRRYRRIVTRQGGRIARPPPLDAMPQRLSFCGDE